MGSLFGSWTLPSSARSARLSAAPRSRCDPLPLRCLTQHFIPSGAASPSSSIFPRALPRHRMAVVLELPLLWHRSPSHLPSALRSPWPVTSPRNLLVSFTDFTTLDCSSVLTCLPHTSLGAAREQGCSCHMFTGMSLEGYRPDNDCGFVALATNGHLHSCQSHILLSAWYPQKLGILKFTDTHTSVPWDNHTDTE